jgi:hypothetical protein
LIGGNLFTVAETALNKDEPVEITARILPDDECHGYGTYRPR